MGVAESRHAPGLVIVDTHKDSFFGKHILFLRTSFLAYTAILFANSCKTHDKRVQELALTWTLINGGRLLERIATCKWYMPGVTNGFYL
jgi:hypothetical protein